MKLSILALAAASLGIVQGQTSYTSTTSTAAWGTSRWNNTADGPAYTSAYTANNAVNFTSGNYSFVTGMGSGNTVNVGNVTLSSGVNVTFSGTIAGTYATGGAVRTIDVGSNSTFNLAGQSLSTAAGTGFIKSGAGTLIITSGATFTGGFTLNAGTMVAGGINAMGGGTGNTLTLNGGILTVNSGTNRDFSGKYTSGITIGGNVQFGDSVGVSAGTGNMTFSNTMDLGAAARTFTLGYGGTVFLGGRLNNTATNGVTFAATAGGTGRFEVTSTSSNFTGPISITGGEVRFAANTSLGNAANTVTVDGGRFGIVVSGATIDLSSRSIFLGSTAGTAITSPGDLTTILQYDGVLQNKSGSDGILVKQGQGMLSLGGVSTYTGNTSINNGNIRLTTGNDRLPTGTVVSIGQAASANLGVLDLNGRNQQIAGLNSTSGTNATANNNTVTSASAATLTIGGAGTYSYGDGTNANSGIITGAISLVKQGSGTQTLGDTNTYTGTTTINGGVLAVNGSLASGSAVTVNSGGTLSGTGTVNGSVTAKSGGIVGPGTSPGILTTGATSFESGSIFSWELNSNVDRNGTAPDGTRGTAFDGLTSSSLSVADGAIFRVVLTDTADIANAFWNQDQVWNNIFSVSGTTTNAAVGQLFNTFQVFSGSTDITTASAPRGYFTFTDSTLNWTAVPEPTSALVGLLIATGLLRRRRVA